MTGSNCRWPIHGFAMAMLRRRLYDAQGGKCGICRGRMKRVFNSPKLTFDHVWPKSRAAAHQDDKFLGNLLLVHDRCNKGKDDSPPSPEQVEFLRAVNRSLGFYPSETAVWDAPVEGSAAA